MRDRTAPYFGSLITASAITARAREREAAARREKEVLEERLRMKAQEARLGRAGFNVDDAPAATVGVGGSRGVVDSYSAGGGGRGGGGGGGGEVEAESPEREPTPEKETREEREERRKRDDIRSCCGV